MTEAAGDPSEGREMGAEVKAAVALLTAAGWGCVLPDGEPIPTDMSSVWVNRQPRAKRHHILHPIKRRRLCDGGPDGRSDQNYACLDNAFLDSVGNGLLPCLDCALVAAKAITGIDAEGLRATLRWYADRTAECRLVHSGGDDGRAALAADGGKRAREALGDV